ncbi:MAG: hypothetical protein MH204_05100, partial [Fimbriimonadaceae bacterium]|nr:hypothetical protein [Fimbriimonadaceae bacterium]
MMLVGSTGSAHAQLDDRPDWAVLDFVLKGDGSESLGREAAKSLAAEIGKQAEVLKVDVVDVETSMRALDQFGYRLPLTSASQLQRVGLALNAVALISGEVVNSRVVTNGDRKQAQVLVRVAVQDVASGITVNGAAVSGMSGVRDSGTADEAMLAEAFEDAGFKAVSQIAGRQLPTGTITSTIDRRALLDKGLRDGLQPGMRVLVLRGREQVALGTLANVDADSAVINPSQIIKGMRSGDKVQVIFDVPELAPTFGPAGEAKVQQRRASGGNQGLVSLLLVLGLVFLLLGQGRASSTDLLSKVRAQAEVTAADEPAVRISWSRDTFLRHNNVVRFQVWRDDVATNPVAVAVGPNSSSVLDTPTGTNYPGVGNGWYDELPILGGSSTGVSDPALNETPTTVALLQPGRPYQYAVEVAYRINTLDLPGEGTTGGTTGGGGIGGGGTTGGGTTGGGTPGGGTTG